MSASDSPLGRMIDRYVDLSTRRPGAVMLVLILVTVLLSLSIPRITVNTRIEALLPEDTVSQKSNDEASRRYAGSSPFFLVVQSSNPEMNRKVSEQALAEVLKWEETRWAIRARDPKFFLDRRLLFVDEKALGEFAEQVDAYVGYSKCKKMPGCFQLEDEPEKPSFDKLREQLKGQTEVQSLSALFGKDAMERAVDTASEEKSFREDGELCTRDGKVCVVQATLDREPSDLEYARRMVARGETLLARLVPKDAPDDTVTAVTGIYRDLPLARAELMDDLTRSFSFGILLMVGVVFVQFRRIRTLPLLFIPLSLGSVWAVGLFAWVNPQLNLISAAGFIILAGLGIDFGLHLLTHFGAEREAGVVPQEALRSTLHQLVSQQTVAALTTAFGFGALMAADFRGFAQLGQFATIGIFAILAATLLTFPPLVMLLQRWRPSEGSFARNWRVPGFLGQGFSKGPAMAVTLVGLALFAVSLVLIPRISLRYDLSSLIKEATSHGTNFREALSGTSRGAVLLLADDEASLEQAAEGLRRRYPNGLTHPEGYGRKKGEVVVGAPVITPGTFIPKDQEAKIEHIQTLRDASKVALKYGDDEWKKQLQSWLPLLEVDAPYSREDLPDWVKNALMERDGRFGTVGLTYQDYPGTHAGKMLELSHKLDKLRADHPQVRFASATAVLGEVMPLLRQDGWRVTGLALVGILIATLVIGRSRRRTMYTLLTICLSVATMTALMVVLDWRIDFYNLLVFPVTFGIGVDGTIYVVWTVLARGGVFEWKHLSVSARAIFGSTMTTVVVFASLATSESGGLASLGKVGASALMLTLIANIVWLPAVLSWMYHAKMDREAQGAKEGEPELSS